MKLNQKREKEQNKSICNDDCAISALIKVNEARTHTHIFHDNSY